LPDATRRRSSWIDSAASVSPSTIIFRPLYSGGLWLPVTITPEPVAKRCVAKYTMGVATTPMSITSTPPAVRPRASARDNRGPDRRPSRPTTNLATPLARPRVARPRPIASAASSVRVLSTMPRMS
jgi:hypothetical protein